MRIIHILNGPNLNLTGRREPDLYGSVSFETYIPDLRRRFPMIEIRYAQSNHEGILIDYLQQYGFEEETGFILNAGGLSHTSIALRDAVAAIPAPVVEVHMSDISRREAFRHVSYLTEVSAAHFIGHGLEGYEMGVRFLLNPDSPHRALPR